MVFFSFCVSAQGDYWQRESSWNSRSARAAQRFDVKKAQTFTLKEGAFREALESASIFGKPNVSGAHPSSGEYSSTIVIPKTEGGLSTYRVQETPVLSPELSQRYPQIKSYSGFNVDHPEEKLRLSVSHNGIQAMVVHADGSANDFMQKTQDGDYLFYSRDAANTGVKNFICETKDKLLGVGGNLTARPVDGQVLRRYRLAVTTSAEYTAYHGGTVADALAAINATVTRVNQVFETDLAVSLELVAETENAIYTDAATDPYGSGLAAFGNIAQNTLTEEVGEENYDIGLVLHSGPDGGNAGFIGAICVDNRKGSAYASSEDPEGDIFDLDFVAHEMGHQLGANHSWSFESEGTTVQVEPATGTTIMGYAGIIEGENVAANGDSYFHYVSIQQISDNLREKSCGELVALANNPPVVEPLRNYVIPRSTAFVLTGSATDSDTVDNLTYTWEQIDNGVVRTMNFGPSNAIGANFRSLPPTVEPVRYFPSLSRVVSGNLTQTRPTEGAAWETISDIARDFNFAFTVRDNAPNGGQVVSEFNTVSVTNKAGPFAVSSQTSNEVYAAGEIREVTWDVANTDVAPVATPTVDILLSTDGGENFTEILAEAVPNDGSHEVIVPGVATDEARIMVRGVDNVFFAVNSADFTIELSEVVLNLPQLTYEVCQPDDLNVSFTYESYLNFSEEVSFSIEGAPEGLQVSFSPETVTASDTAVDILFGNTGVIPEGNYDVQLVATSASVTRRIDLQLGVFDNDFSDVELIAPLDGATDVSTIAPFEWEDDASVTSYEIQIASDPSFSDILETETVFSSSYRAIGLENNADYFWRVKALNACGEGSFGPARSFTTIAFSCDNKMASALPKEISPVGTPTVVSTISFAQDLVVTDIDVLLNIDHAYLEDLTVSLTSPSNTTVVLFSNACGDLNGVNATFDDDAPDFVCGGSAAAAIAGRTKPSQSLSAFNGESALGDWVLTVQDNFDSDGGAINAFSLDICAEGEFRPDADNDGVFDDGDDLCPDTPAGAEVDVTGCQIFRFASDNFSISTESTSCRNNDDGAVTIEAVLSQGIVYNLDITGNGATINDTFTNTITVPGLTSGSYSVCIAGTTAEVEYQETCFEIVISQPDPLEVSTNLVSEGTQLNLSMEGAETYTISLNGKQTRVQGDEITLDLHSGVNRLKVFTDKSCQGIYEDEVIVAYGPSAYPNPTASATRLFLGVVEETLSVSIFSPDGHLVRETTYRPNGNQIDLDFTGLPAGVYIVKFTGPNSQGTTKVIKR